MKTSPLTRRQTLQRFATSFASLTAVQAAAPLTAHAQGKISTAGPKVTPLFTQSLAAHGESDVHMVLVEYAGGGHSPPHQHAGPVFVYVLEGAVEMQITDGEIKTVRKGETFYEPPGAVHLVSRNASATESARLLAIVIGDKGTPVTRPPDKS